MKRTAFCLILVFAVTAAMAETRSPLKPSPELMAADVTRLIEDLKAAKATDQQLAGAEALYNHMQATGLASELSPAMLSFIQATSAHDAATAKDLLAKMTPFELGEAAYILHNYGMAQKYWLPLAQAGDAQAEANVGLMYSGGNNGATQSDAESFKWYRLAALAGNEVAQENLATLNAEGRGVAKSPAQSYVWLSVAAAQAVKDGHTATSKSVVQQRDKLAAQLDSDALDHALSLAGRCSESQYKDCE